MSKTADRWIKCPNCKRECTIRQGLQLRKVPSTKYTQFYLRCLYCEHETHSFFMTPVLETMQGEVKRATLLLQERPSEATQRNYERVKAAYGRRFNAVQAEAKDVINGLRQQPSERTTGNGGGSDGADGGDLQQEPGGTGDAYQSEPSL